MSQSKLKVEESMWAEMSPDTYGGESCDEIVPRWETHALDSKGDTDHMDTVSLSAKTFPPGTTIVISEPVCPNCSLPSGYFHNQEAGEMGKCDCGFDWTKWVKETYA